MVDFIRRRSKTRTWVWLCIVIAPLLVSAGWATKQLANLQPAAPSVDGTVLYGSVSRGPMVREVSGRGPLVPVSVTIVTADIAGQIAEVHVQPGVKVEKGTVLIRMTDPVVERNLVEAKRSLASAEFDRDRFKLLLEQQGLDLRMATSQARATWEDAKGEYETKAELVRLGIISLRENQLLRLRTERSWNLFELQLARVENNQKTNQIHLQEKEAAIARANDVVLDRMRDLEALQIRATTTGILQELGPGFYERWEVGQRIPTGGRVAKITDPSNLKALIEVSAVQVREVVIGQSVLIDTLSTEILGKVVRVDTAVQDGKVAVDVELSGELPSGARPDLEVYGKIEIERLNDVLQLSPVPGMASPNSTVKLFRLSSDGSSADPVAVQLGRASLNVIEIVGGLQEGDRIIVSDMSYYEDANRVLLPRQ